MRASRARRTAVGAVCLLGLVPAAVVAWLATAPEARELNGQTIMAQRHCLKLNLVPEWQPKRRGKS